MKIILVAQGERKELAKLFGVTERSVYNALKTDRDTDLCRRIRKAALERGGAQVEQKPKQSNF